MNPDDLLQQIGELVGQYLAAAPDSPIAGELQGIAEAIASNMSADLSAEPGVEPGLGGSELPPEEMDLEEPPPGTSKSFEGARANAEDRLKKRNLKTRA